MLLALCATTLLAACKGRHQLSTSVTTTHDSVVVKLVPRDTLIWVRRESVALHIPTPPDLELRQVQRSNGSARLTLSAHNGQLRADCVCDSASIKARLLDTWTRELHTREQHTTDVRVETQTVTPRWAWWALASALGLSAWTLRKPLWRLWTLLKPV